MAQDQDQAKGPGNYPLTVDTAIWFAKLAAGGALRSADLKALELLIVGDAEYYVKYESELEE